MYPGKNGYNFQNTPVQSYRKSVGSMQMGANKSMNQSKDFINDFSQKLNKHEDEIEARNYIIKEMEQNIEVLKKEYIVEKKKGNEKDQYISQLQSAYHQLENKNQQIVVKMEEMQGKILQYERQFSSLKDKDNLEKIFIEKENEFNKQISGLKTEISNKAKELEEKNKNLDEIKLNLKNKEEEIGTLKVQLDERASNIISFKAQLKDKAEKIDGLEDNIEKLKSKLTEQQQNYEKKIDRLEQENSKLEKQITNLKLDMQADKSLKSEFNNIKEEMKKNLDRIIELENQLRDAEKYKQKVESLENSITDLHRSYQEKSELASRQRRQSTKEFDVLKNTLKEQENRNKQLKTDLASTEMEKSQLSKMMQNIKEKDSLIRQNISIIDKNESEVMKNLKCNHCNKVIKEPVTIIPCGHNFCLQCKVAYTKQCIKCGPKVKIEAMYRNELLDDILDMAKIMKETKDCLKSLIK